MDFTLTVPDELLPALVAEFSLVQGSTTATSPEEYFTASVIETVRQRAELYKVGPYFTGAVNPQFRQDGMPFDYVEPEESKVVDGVTFVRARDEQGQFLADDPATPDVDEAWVAAVDNDTTTEPEATE